MSQLINFIEKYDITTRWPSMQLEFFGNSVHNYFLSLLTFIAVWWVLLFLRSFAKARVHAIAVSEGSQYWALLRDLLREIRPFFFPVMAIYIATRRLDLSPITTRYLTIICMAVLVIQIVKIASELIVFFITRNRTDDTTDVATRNANRNIIMLIRFALWSAGALFILDNAGFNVATFIAGLGIGGVAIALASQAILGDTFSSFAISLDKPFEPGDYVVVDNFQGTIEVIGLKTTRIRSHTGELVIFSNSDLSKSRIKNYKRMQHRRISTKLGVTYDTSSLDLRRIPDLILNIVNSVEHARMDKVHFASYGDSALIFELTYFVPTQAVVDFMDVQQEINFRIHEEFGKAGINFAFPSQTLYLHHNKP